MRTSARSIIGVLEQQSGVLFVYTDGMVDDGWSTGVVDESAGQIAEPCQYRSLAGPRDRSLDCAFATFAQHELVGQDTQSVLAFVMSACAKPRRVYLPTSNANFRG